MAKRCAVPRLISTQPVFVVCSQVPKSTVRKTFYFSERKVAFLARVDVDLVANAPIPFHAVDFNVGNAYDHLSGIFTAPHSGVYLLSTQMFPQFTGDVLVDIYKNGGILARMRVYDSVLPTSESTSIIDHANAGDKYWVQVTVGGHVYAGVHSYFSGVIVFPDN